MFLEKLKQFAESFDKNHPEQLTEFITSNEFQEDYFRFYWNKSIEDSELYFDNSYIVSRNYIIDKYPEVELFLTIFADLDLSDYEIQHLYLSKRQTPLHDLRKIREFYLINCRHSENMIDFALDDLIFCYNMDMSTFDQLIERYKTRKYTGLYNMIKNYSEADILVIIKIAELLNAHMSIHFDDSKLQDFYYINGGHKYSTMTIQTANRLDIIPSSHCEFEIDIITTKYYDNIISNSTIMYLNNMSDAEQYKFVLWVMNDKLKYDRTTLLEALLESSKFHLAELFYQYLVKYLDLPVESDRSQNDPDRNRVMLWNFKDIKINDLIYIYTHYSKLIICVKVICNDESDLDVQFQKILEFIELVRAYPKSDKFNYKNHWGKFNTFNEHINIVFDFNVKYIKSQDETSFELTPLGEKFVEKLNIAVKTGFNFSAISGFKSPEAFSEFQKTLYI